MANDRNLRLLASAGLGVGGILGMAGTFMPRAGLRGLAWGIDGAALVMAAAALSIVFFRRGHDLVAAGFLVFGIGESLIVATAAMDLAASGPSFGAGVALWATGLTMISASRVMVAVVRLLGLLAAALFTVTALQIFSGAGLTPLSTPLPFFAYPVLVATMAGWIWTLMKHDRP